MRCMSERDFSSSFKWSRGGLLTAWPSVQFCTPVRRHEVAGRWRDTWQKCAWARFLCRVIPPDHCKDQLEETQETGHDTGISSVRIKSTWRERDQCAACSAVQSCIFTYDWTVTLTMRLFPCLIMYPHVSYRWLNAQTDLNGMTQLCIRMMMTLSINCQKCTEPFVFTASQYVLKHHVRTTRM